MAARTKKKYDIGILGWWYGKNYGSVLTYYGLNRAIVGLGYSVLMINETLGYNGFRVTWPFDIFPVKFARRVGYNFTEQRHFSRMPALNEEVETFVVGSDQLWNPLIGRVNDDLFLDFVGPENRRVAYGTSFGNRGIAKFKPDFVEKHSANLKKFDAISVREGYAIDTARDVFGVEATKVVDPVFLLPREDYEKLAAQATIKPSGDYLAVFFLDPTPEKKRVAEAIADKLGLEKVVVIPNPDGGRKLAREIFREGRFEVLGEDAPENFLHAYSKARYVVTDSFHGTAFSVIFGKPFSSIYNTHRGADRFKNLLASLGFDETRRVHETDGPEEIARNPNVALAIDLTTAEKHIEAERAASLRWLKAALSGRADWFDSLKDKYRSLRPARDQDEGDVVARPAFTAGNAAWTVTPSKAATGLAVAPGAAVRGNQVWCDLPVPLEKGAAYRLTLRWTPRTTARAINLHIRNPDTGRFRVIGTVALTGRGAERRDTAEFVVPEDGFTQFMLGAIHFPGENAGAEIASIAVKEIPAATVKPPAPAKKAPGMAERAMDLALRDNDRFVKAHARSMATRGINGARARLMFHAHAIEKGLSRGTDFRAGFGRIAVPGLAREMNDWLAAGRDRKDQFLQTAASVMRVYFERHRDLNVDVSAFRTLFGAPALELIEAAEYHEGGVIAAAAPREPKAETNRDRNFLDVIYGRRSVREFTPAPVRTEDIRQAVQIAMQAPSVCNRQAARVHVFDDPRDIKAAIDLQGGFGGYQMPPKLLLVTCDLDAFLFAAERNQPFIDGGLFMMTLLLGLEQVGLGSCSLNTAMGTERETKIRKLLNIPDNEIFISFVAVGHYDPAILTPRSKRVAVEEVLVRHGPGR